MVLRYALPLFLAATAVQASAQPGSLDASFDSDGILLAQPGDFHDVAYDVAAMADNTILVCGVARHDGRNAIFIAHFLESGELDIAFGTQQGYTYFNLGEEAYGYAMGLDSQGRIYVAGLAYPTFAQAITVLVRTDAAGIPDVTFDNDGILEIPIGSNDSEAKGLVVLPDDEVILGGSVVGTDFVRDAMMVKVSQSGVVDTNFGVNGFATADGPSGEALLNDIALLETGAVVGVGYTDVSFVQKAFVMQVNPDGSLDTAFDGDGVLLPALGSNDHSAWGVVGIGSRVLFTGMLSNGTETDIFTTLVSPDGTFAPQFNGGAPMMIDIGDYELGFDLALANGQIYLCGTTGQPGFGSPRDFFVAKVNGAGVLNAAFGSGGSTVTSVQGDFDDANAITVQPDGKLVCVGFTAGFTSGGDNDVAVVRYLDDGSTDLISGPAPMIGSVWPNPTTGSAIRVSLRDEAPLRIRILDASGREVLNEGLLGNNDQAVINVERLSHGRYTVRIEGRSTVVHHNLVIAR